jgi:segregation and condensation protein B
VEEIRGVDSASALKVLLERALVKVLGRKDEPGRPLLYGTAPAFLDLFGLKSLSDLPTLKEFAELTDESRALFARKTGEAIDEIGDLPLAAAEPEEEGAAEPEEAGAAEPEEAGQAEPDGEGRPAPGGEGPAGAEREERAERGAGPGSEAEAPAAPGEGEQAAREAEGPAELGVGPAEGASGEGPSGPGERR